jgi:hypothetical protein
MKTKDIILIAVAVVGILLFTVFMFIDHRESEKNKLLREDLASDSLIMLKQQDFMYMDSVIVNDLDRHERRIFKLEHMHRHRDTIKK